ncbi:PQQ-binding-like beta-propeller repeat protein [Parabacteroides sp. PF5-9]|uniref:outer membrane protein assembly factor BamB family protein n=1 Tax=Parabacteroides sp. PF5-9 TaxID=1742404 RepID=UPI0024764CF7|nr:PQQ-binding-like beta-propeller repeat protein [Parabacteroides sp. PF5-9]MDH6356217.1 outer membrane protein assembly factor BamB [Parabacteroides sp. PF5-9]
MKTKHFLVVIMAFLAISPIANAQDWPQFLGPDRDSKSPQKGLLKSWPESGPEVLWSVNVGIGYGGPVVKNGKVYLLDRDDETGDIMRCFDLNTGRELWKFSYDSPGEIPFPGSRSVPIVDDKHVYACGAYGDLYCFDIQTQKPVWNKNVWKDFGGENPPIWGVSQSPVIYGDLLIIASMAPDAGVVAYKKQTGEIAWKTPNLGNESYVSPKIMKIHGEDHVVIVNSSTNPFGHAGAPVTKGSVVGLDPATGKTLWKYADWDCHISVACPTDAGNNKLLIVGGYERGATMIQVNKKNDGTFDTTELFTTLEFGDQTKPALFHNGYFYAMFRTNQKRDGLVCMDMNGKIMWKTGRNPNFDRGSMILADGLILATDGLKTLYLIEPDPTAFKQISKADVLSEGGVNQDGMARMGGGTQNWAPIALADGKLLVRDQAKMVCVKVTQ